MKKLKEILAQHKAKAQSVKNEELRCEFRVVERNGALFLTHLGVAFKRVPNDCNAENVALMLNQVRDTAVEFEKY